jgi:hypothetical protein
MGMPQFWEPIPLLQLLDRNEQVISYIAALGGTVALKLSGTPALSLITLIKLQSGLAPGCPMQPV